MDGLMCVYLCVCVCMDHRCVNACIKRLCMHVHANVNVDVCAKMGTCMYVHVYVQMHAYNPASLYVGVCMCMCIHVYVCRGVCLFDSLLCPGVFVYICNIIRPPWGCRQGLASRSVTKCLSVTKCMSVKTSTQIIMLLLSRPWPEPLRGLTPTLAKCGSDPGAEPPGLW